jgi:hypothetical protein
VKFVPPEPISQKINFLNEKLVPGTYFIGKFIPPM